MSWSENSNSKCFDECYPVSSIIKDLYKEQYGQIMDIALSTIHNTIEKYEKHVETCINELKRYAEKGLREKVVEIISKFSAFFNTVYQKVYYEAKTRLNMLARRMGRKFIIRARDLMFLVLERFISWITNVAERIRKILEPYHVVLGIKDFSLSVNVSTSKLSPSISFGLTITFNL